MARTKRRLKKQIRKTMGALFLASAIGVAAIPTTNYEGGSAQADEQTEQSTSVGITHTTHTTRKVSIKDKNGKIGGTDVDAATGITETRIPEIDESNKKVIGDNSIETPLAIYHDPVERCDFVLDKSSGTSGRAMLVNVTASPQNNTMVIPNTLDAYVAAGSGEMEYCAVNNMYEEADKKRSFIYYCDIINHPIEYEAYTKDEAGVETVVSVELVHKDENGNVLTSEYTTEDGTVVYTRKKADAYTEFKYYPCFESNESYWSAKEDAGEDFYYYIGDKKADEIPEYISISTKDEATAIATKNSKVCTSNDTPSTEWLCVATQTTKRLKDVPVAFISNKKYIGKDSDKKPKFIKCTGSSSSIFYEKNFEALVLGSNMVGIGNYAFVGQTALKTVTIGDGNSSLSEIGNHAFDNCINLSQFNIPITASMNIIGEYAFYNSGLTSFQMPVNTQKIGDSAFESCTKLVSIDLTGGDTKQSVSLTTIGNDAFRNCSSLESLSLPENYNEKELDICVISGCDSLQKVSSTSNAFTFVDSANGNYTLAQFQKYLAAVGNKTFYFESDEKNILDPKCALHLTALNNYFAFHYLNGYDGQDVYEKRVLDETATAASGEDVYATFRVTKDGTLLKCPLKEGLHNLIIPENIGICEITSLGNQAFINECTLDSVVIPASVQSIGSECFKGCHFLKSVTFTDANNISSIGDQAFRTQTITSASHKGCQNKTLVTNPELFFVGSIGNNIPFTYAMERSNNIDDGIQKAHTYITYCSGWPTNLVVQYNYDTDSNELISYPTIENLPTYESKYSCYINSRCEDYSEMKDALSKIATNYDSYVTKDPGLTNYGYQLIDKVVNVELPVGIESIKEEKVGTEYFSLFQINEKEEIANDAGKHQEITKHLTTHGLSEIKNNEFAGITTLQSVVIEGDNTTKIGDYAFGDCTQLSSVYITSAVADMGLRPFTGDAELKEVNFGSGSSFYTEGNMLFQNTEGGVLLKELLESRKGMIAPSELANVSQLEKECFMGTPISSVDLSKSGITTVPERAFQCTKSLYSVYLPYKISGIREDAFSDSGVQVVKIPTEITVTISTDAFRNTIKKVSPVVPSAAASSMSNGKYFTGVAKEATLSDASTIDDSIITRTKYVGLVDDYTNNDGSDMTNKSTLTLVCPEAADAVRNYASINGINVADTEPEAYYTVTFKTEDGSQVLYTAENVLVGTRIDVDALIADGAITIPEKPGYVFSSFFPDTAYNPVKGDAECWVKYVTVDESHKVTFIDGYDQSTLGTKTVLTGADVTFPTPPIHDGYEFDHWLCNIAGFDENNITELTEDAIYTAVYYPQGVQKYSVYFYDEDGKTELFKSTKLEGEALTENEYPVAKAKEGYRFKGWVLTAGDPDNILSDVKFIAQFENEAAITYHVYFLDSDGKTELYNFPYIAGASISESDFPTAPAKDGYIFKEWVVMTGDISNIQSDIKIVANYDIGTYNIYFYDENMQNVISQFPMVAGGSLSENSYPAGPVREGYKFVQWILVSGSISPVNSDVKFMAKYEVDNTSKDPVVTPDPEPVYHTVKFFDVNPEKTDEKTLISEQQVEDGKAATAPTEPVHAGYKFTGWSPAAFTNITSDLEIYATYTSNGSEDGGSGDNSGDGTGGDKGGDTTGGGTDSGSGETPTPTPTASTTEEKKFYTLSVVNGSGSGTYQEGSQAIIVANEPQSGYVFSEWTISPSNAPIASKGLSATVITMPSENVTVTAVYTAKKSDGTSSGSGSSSGGNSGSSGNGTSTTPAPTTKPTAGGTTVVIDKNGLSNTGVVAATVNGSSDNFTIKVTESSTAAEAALKALIAQYGSVNNLVYFPMDISLYDAAGTTKITDTTGLSVTITLPLPDSMVQYGGNNKVANVIDGQLNSLAPKFTTISGVPCVTFTATHFSPYVIYVDTANLTAGGDIDSSPKTADGIHPKWFLSLGLFAISMVLFLKKDKKKALVKA